MTTRSAAAGDAVVEELDDGAGEDVVAIPIHQAGGVADRHVPGVRTHGERWVALPAQPPRQR